jgi:LysR family transcriptional activator of nhaA
MLNYNHLYYFHMAATLGSVASAAHRLRVTQPTVSEQLRSLERALDVSLFERKPTGLALTDAGRLAFEHTSVMFRAGERLVESLGQDTSSVPRTLRVGISGAVSRSTTSDFLMPLLAIDGCMPTIRSGDTAELLRDLRGNEVDLLLCETEPPEAALSGLEIATIDRSRLVAVAPPTVKPDQDWENVGLIQYRLGSSYRWDVEAFLDARGLRPRIAAEADDAQFLMEAASRGGYVAVVPRSVARDAISAGRLRIIADVDNGHAGVYAVYEDGLTADLARRAVEVLIEQARASKD